MPKPSLRLTSDETNVRHMEGRSPGPRRPEDNHSVVLIPVSLLNAADDNPRVETGDLTELARSILSVGILQPLLVLQDTALTYRIVCGERRWLAAQMAGLDEVPCIVRVFDERSRQEAMLIENLQRKTLRPLEEGAAYKRLLDLAMTQVQIARRVGRSQAHISRRLALLSLPHETQSLLEKRAVRINEALGYRSNPRDDIFAADERLHRTWIALREEVLDQGDQRLIRLLYEFSAAYTAGVRQARGPRREPESFRGNTAAAG